MNVAVFLTTQGKGLLLRNSGDKTEILETFVENGETADQAVRRLTAPFGEGISGLKLGYYRSRNDESGNAREHAVYLGEIDSRTRLEGYSALSLERIRDLQKKGELGVFEGDIFFLESSNLLR